MSTWTPINFWTIQKQIHIPIKYNTDHCYFSQTVAELLFVDCLHITCFHESIWTKASFCFQKIQHNRASFPWLTILFTWVQHWRKFSFNAFISVPQRNLLYLWRKCLFSCALSKTSVWMNAKDSFFQNTVMYFCHGRKKRNMVIQF